MDNIQWYFFMCQVLWLSAFRYEDQPHYTYGAYCTAWWLVRFKGWWLPLWFFLSGFWSRYETLFRDIFTDAEFVHRAETQASSEVLWVTVFSPQPGSAHRGRCLLLARDFCLPGPAPLCPHLSLWHPVAQAKNLAIILNFVSLSLHIFTIHIQAPSSEYILHVITSSSLHHEHSGLTINRLTSLLEYSSRLLGLPSSSVVSSRTSHLSLA